MKSACNQTKSSFSFSSSFYDSFSYSTYLPRLSYPDIYGIAVSSSVSPASGLLEPFVEINIIDTGPGIAPEDLEKIFERFFRGDAARTRSVDSLTDGAGLGLAIARRIAVAHGGRLVVASSRPGLTEFALSLPID